MQEIKCPNCGEVFQVDETGYAQILQQVRDKEFEKELKRREEQLSQSKKSEIELMKMELEKSFDEKIAAKNSETAKLNLTIEQLKAEIAGSKSKAELEKSQAVREQERQSESELVKKNEELSQRDAEIARLKEKLTNSKTEQKLAVADALRDKERELTSKSEEIISLKSKLEGKETETALKEKSIKEQYEEKLRLKDEQIEYYKDFKARQSTKMVGESLEQHCMTLFNQLRATAFKNAYFEKDNDAKTGSKGDFIFRDYSDGEEFISIMFEMKNEMDTTATKHKNEDFFKELDKDRREKNCEYAILVSLLEIDNELYNSGIVDVSHRYEKMYVIRPQFFIPMITLLRDAALNSLDYKKELSIVRNQQIDIMNFEENMNSFKEAFGRNYDLASRKFQKAIDEIDKSIKNLQNTREALISSENNLRLANKKAEDLTIKRLTKNAPSVKEMFNNLNKQ